ncbi:hypothetical protein Tco_0018396 [Tanacetum coccineum]
MSTSKTYQQSLADAGSETRPPMLERGSYIPWASRFRRYINQKRENRKWLNKALDEGPYQFEMFIPNNSTVPKLQTAEDLQGDALLHYDAEMELMNLDSLSIPNDIYNSVDACTSAKDMWKRVERLMRGTIQNKVDRETRFTNEFDQFVAEPGEALVSVYNRFAQLMNDLERNDMHFPIEWKNLKNSEKHQCLWPEFNQLGITTLLLGQAMILAFIMKIQSSSNNENEEQMYPTHTKIINSTIGDNQIDSDIIFDSPNRNVNSGSIENRISHVLIFVIIIRDLEKQRDKLDLDVKDYKRQNEELQKTHSILKRQMSENEDKYHDTVLDLEAN